MKVKVARALKKYFRKGDRTEISEKKLAARAR